MSARQKVLVIGAGELGYQVLNSLAKHPRQAEAVAVLLRPGSISSTNSSKKEQNERLRSFGISLISGDILEDSESALVSIFKGYDIIIGCAGFVSGKGVQSKVTRAVLKAKVPYYIPWQFGVDYDLIGRGSPQDLFDEQLDVRDLLRSQNETRWTIISTGMFTSFLFEPFFGVVDLQNGTVSALGGWENQVTVTTPADIGRFTAEIVLGEGWEENFADCPIFIGGDTISYEELAQLIERVTGKVVKRNVRAIPEIKAALSQEPDNGILKYQAVFGQGRGVAWDISKAWNTQKGLRTITAEEWAKNNLV
ncbi:uncharacterized protein N7483_012897 [Penicillium malachiteum]|uniref:uncharacterized protein n=1 Tax=Penicillium malachiteum TaxID=1324776 RepID=UPI002547C145|nr:uncharacterized protein N7483_012897 [Penicillium malachiteum]KAJ5715716.1 hypothetical protein N7483_012897 [Penicillium malachiteum]